MISWGVLRLAPVLFVCAACFADQPPAGLGSGASSDAGATTTSTTTGSLGTTGGGATGTTSAMDTGTSGATGSVATSGAPATTADETTGAVSTSDRPGTTVGGTTAAPPWDACGATDMQVACVGCCADAIVASKVYYAAFGECLCDKVSPCLNACQANLCFVFGNASQACLDCAAGPGIGCQQAALDACAGDPGCAEFLGCVEASGCGGKP